MTKRASRLRSVLRNLGINVVPDKEVTTGTRPLIYVGGDADVAHLVPGSEQRTCAGCAKPIWYSPASLSLLAETTRPTTLNCFECAMKSTSN